MNDEFKIINVKNSDLNDVLSIFNYYIKNGFAAYTENEVKIDFFLILNKSLGFFTF